MCSFGEFRFGCHTSILSLFIFTNSHITEKDKHMNRIDHAEKIMLEKRCDFFFRWKIDDVTWKIHGRLFNISTQANSFFGTQVTKAVPLSNNFKSIERLKSININEGIGPQVSVLLENVVGLDRERDRKLFLDDWSRKEICLPMKYHKIIRFDLNKREVWREWLSRANLHRNE